MYEQIIRVEKKTHAALAALKGDDESFDELLSRLLRERQETIESGAGLWANTDAADGAREARKQLRENIDAQ